jgi:5-methylcytosine-specific restriction endonuclease McrA
MTLRAIKLSEIVAGPVNDAVILQGVSAELGLTLQGQKTILRAYTAYRKRKGTNAIQPLKLKAPLPDDLSKLYSGRTIKHGLDWIDSIATTTKYGYCPMCGAETHKTVEHFLPRKPWAEFSIFSLNLVPSCGTCNGKRGNRANKPNRVPRLYHPYFDAAILKKRLHITSIEPPYSAPVYAPKAAPRHSHAVRKKIENHLTLNIDMDVYVQFCTNRWADVQLEAKRAPTLAALSVRLKTLSADSIALTGINSWRSAFFAGLTGRASVAKWLFSNRSSF